MSLISVSSSAIAAIGYENGTLAVKFHDSGIYHHHGVPYSVFEGLLNATSPGTYYNKHIRGKFK